MTATKPQPRDTVPPGYKQTEVGVIPEDWELALIGKHFEFKNGLNKAKQFFGHGTPIVNYMDVYKKPGLKHSDVSGSVSLSRDEIRRYSALRGDVFFTRTSETLAEIGLASVLLEDIPSAVFSGFVLRGRPIADDLSVQFSKYCFRSLVVRQQIVSRGTYTTRALTNGRQLSMVKVPLPPTRAEQEAIAGALSDADAWIESLEKLIAKKRAIKQGTMQALLTPPGQPGHRRLPGFDGEWEVKRVGEMGEVITGGTPRTGEAQFWGGKYPWVTPTDISSVRDMTTSERRLTRPGMDSIRALPANTVLVTCIASIGKNAILRKPGACNQQINAIIPNDISCPEFLYYMFESSKQYLVSNSGITATRILSKVTFSELAFQVPDCPEQTAIAVVLSDMGAEIEALEAKLAKARQIKQGMMQELLTGRIRLVKPKGGH